MILRALPLIFSLLLLSCSHKSSDHKLRRTPASFNFSNLKNFDSEKWLQDISNTDVYKNKEAGTIYGKAVAGKIVEALKFIQMKPGTKKGSYFQKFEVAELSSQNIIALSHTRKEKLPQVIISAHYNRVGFCKTDNNNKNCFVKSDNALGTIAALKLVALLRRHSPNTSIALTLWGAEEIKGAGSQFFVSSPSFSLKETMLRINLDFVGTDNLSISTLNTQDTKYKNTIRNITGLINQKNEFRTASHVYRSDYKTFFKAGHRFPTMYLTDHKGLNLKPFIPISRNVSKTQNSIDMLANTVYRFINDSLDESDVQLNILASDEYNSKYRL